MERSNNETGKPFWVNVKLDDEFSTELFHDVAKSNFEIEFANKLCREPDDQIAFHSNLGSLTVLDRMTGYGFRDTESGFRDTDGKFWLASGGFDVSRSECKTIGEAIQWVKDNANNCKGE